MFDNRIATLEKTQGKFYCASVLKDSRVRTRVEKEEPEIDLLSQIEI